MPNVNLGQVPFTEAIAFFNNKVKIPTKRWDDMRGDIHAKAFTVAGATNMDVLSDIHQAVKQALENGTTITNFRKAFDKTVQDNGWSYNGKRGWRTRVIYDTNLRTAHMAGKWDQIQRTKATRPYLQYLTVGDARVRPQHAEWHAKVLPVDDSWWNTHYPPNGWGCRCTVRSLSETQLKRAGLTVDQAPAVKNTRRVNPDTGEDYGEVPDGIDVGWDYNVGKAWLGPDIAFGKKAIALPAAVRKAVLTDQSVFADVLQKPFEKWAGGVFSNQNGRGEYHVVGFLRDSTILYLLSNEVLVTNAAVTISDHRLRRMRRDNKTGIKLGTRTTGNDISIPQHDIEQLPTHLASPDAVVWDRTDKKLLYVFDPEESSKKGKIIIAVEFNEKGAISNSIRSGSLINPQALQDKTRYEMISGKL